MPRLRATTPSASDVRGELRRRLRRVRGQGWSIAQTAVAAGAAWKLASLVNAQPFFAPVSAVIALGVARGRRTVRAVELVIGVAVGIAVADLIVLGLGTGTPVIALVVALTMGTALLLGAGTVLVNQAAVSAILVATISPPSSGLSPNRFIDALIGGAMALLVGQVLFPRDPVRQMARAARPLAEDLARALRCAAEALRTGDRDRARRALELARATDGDLAAFFDAVALARETFSFRRPRREETRERVPLYAEAAQRMDHAVRNTRVLARRALAATRSGPAPPALADAVGLLARAVLELASQLEDPAREVATRQLALEAAAQATTVLDGDPDLSISVIVGQVRSTAVDLLRGSGLSGEDALRALDGVAVQ